MRLATDPAFAQQISEIAKKAGKHRRETGPAYVEQLREQGKKVGMAFATRLAADPEFAQQHRENVWLAALNKHRQETDPAYVEADPGIRNTPYQPSAPYAISLQFRLPNRNILHLGNI